MAVHVLIIMTTPLTLDGISSMVMNYMKHFDPQKVIYDFVVWNDVRDDIKERVEKCGRKIYKLPNRTRSPINYYYALKTLIKNDYYPIVHAHGNSSTLYIEMLAAKQAGVNVRISHCHNSTCAHMLLHRLLKWPFMHSYSHAFACSKKAGEWLFDGPFEIVTNGIELDRFSYKKHIRDKVRNELGLSGKKVIGHIGIFNIAKNHEFLIDIFANLVKRDNSYRLVLIGEGRLKNKVRDKVRKLGLNDYLLFLGSRNDVQNLLQAIDLFVMPSRYEGLPFVLIEAQAAGLPCVVSKNITEEVNITGLLKYVSLEQPPEYWANEIEKMPNIDREMASIKACEALRNAGYDIKVEAKKLENRYLSMLEELK